MNKNKTKTGNKLPKGTHNEKTKLRKVDGFNLCTQEYDAYIGAAGIAGTGAFSYRVYPGDCDEVRQNDESIFPRPYISIHVVWYRTERCLALNSPEYISQ